jgi:ABC-type phosphate/phosphonate transport system substrate-binding protein
MHAILKSAALVVLCVLGGSAAAEESAGGAAEKATKIGAVAYSPAAVTIFRDLTRYLGERGLKADYVLYSNYDSLLGALDRGEVDIAWNTPLAHAQFHVRSGGACRTLVMRDVDVGVRSVLVARPGAQIKSVADLAGKRLVLGSEQAAEATVLPRHFLKQEGVELDRVTIVSLEREVDSAGNPCASPGHVLAALRAGRGDAGIITSDLWEHVQASEAGKPNALQLVWTSPPFSHCVFTASDKLDDQRAAKFTELMQAMRPAGPTRELMELEGTRKWLAGSSEGFADLIEAVGGK